MGGGRRVGHIDPLGLLPHVGQRLEEIALSFDGVSKSYAMQAGREIRIVVEPEKLDDYQCKEMAESIAKKIESELKYPGQIKVTVVRETRAVEFAK